MSYTLRWKEFDQNRFLSFGPHATLAYAREAAAQKERELNSFDHRETLQPITWTNFIKQYLDTFYPGHDLGTTERKEKVRTWGKSPKTLKREKLAIGCFAQLMKPEWCHKIGAECAAHRLSGEHPRQQPAKRRLPVS